MCILIVAHITATLQEGVYENAPFVPFGESSRNIKNIYLYENVSTEHGSYMVSSRIFC